MDRRRFPRQARVPDAGWARGRRGTQDAQSYSLAAFVSKTTSPISNSTVIRLLSAIAPAMSTTVLLSRRCFAFPLLDREVVDPVRHWQQHAGRGPSGPRRRPSASRCRREPASACGGGRVEAAGGKLQHGLDAAPRHRELLDDLVDGHAVLHVLESDGHGRACAPKHPGAAHLARGAFNDGTLTALVSPRLHGHLPIECRAVTPAQAPRRHQFSVFRSLPPPSPGRRSGRRSACQLSHSARECASSRIGMETCALWGANSRVLAPPPKRHSRSSVA